MLYDDARYVRGGRFAEARFDRLCLTEYAEVFKTVCVDGAYYRFPEPAQIEGLVGQVPPDFRFGFKVTDEITLKRFPNLPRFGVRAGKANANFLNADLFATGFLAPCEPFRTNLGLLIFEFSQFHRDDYEHGRDFVADLDRFLGRLPKGWPYGVELRNRHFLQPEYFDLLARHEVAHVYNNWAGMPDVAEQMVLPKSLTHPKLCAARFLLKPGRRYQEAVDLFSPYNRIQDPNPSARAAGARLILTSMAAGAQHKTYIFVNNRLEGNALLTIEAMLAEVGSFRNAEKACPSG